MATPASAFAVDLWWVDLESSVDPTALPAWLPEEDCQRVRRMGTPLLQTRMAATRIAVRSILSDYLQTPPDRIPICCTAHGRPGLGPNWQEKPLWFNLSHTEGQMVLAISREADLGVDLECNDRAVEPDKLAPMVFNAGDMQWLDRQPHRCRAFLQLWTAKEAVLKLWGTGLQLPATQVQVDWTRLRSRIAPEARYFPGAESVITPLRDDHAYVAHLASAAAPVAIRHQEYRFGDR